MTILCFCCNSNGFIDKKKKNIFNIPYKGFWKFYAQITTQPEESEKTQTSDHSENIGATDIEHGYRHF